MSDRRRNRDLRREINDPMQDWPINGVGGQDVALPPGTVRTRGDLINVIGGDGPTVSISAVLTAGAGDLINVTGGDAPTIDLAVDITAGAGDLINVTGGGAPTINIEGGVAAGAGALINVTGGGAPAVDIPALITAGAGDLINVTGGAAPTVTAGQDLNVSAGAGDLINVTGGEFPVVDITGNVTAGAGESITVTGGDAPTVTAGADLNVIAGAGDLINVTGGGAPTVSVGSSDAYIVNSFAPPVVADFAGVLNSGTEYYRVGGSDSTFDSMFTFSRPGLATMVDSDGKLKWAPHNLLSYSADFGTGTWSKSEVTAATDTTTDPDSTTTADEIVETTASANHTIAQTFTTISGEKYSYSIFLKRRGSGNQYVTVWLGQTSGTIFNMGTVVDLVNGTITEVTGFNSLDSSAIVDVGSGWYQVTITGTALAASTAQAMVYLLNSSSFANRSYTGDGTSGTYLWGAHVYRSSLGGMTDNPDRGDSYVPTTTAAVYQARRNHYRWNGSSYVNKGILLESEARTNYFQQSNDFSAKWANVNTSESAASVTLPTGNSGGWEIIENSSNARHILYDSPSGSAGVRCYSKIMKQNTRRYVQLQQADSSSRYGAVFDLQLGTVTDTESSGSPTGTGSGIEDLGGGWYRCYVTKTYGSGTLYTTTALSDSGTPSYDSNGNPTYTGDGSSGIYAFHAQYENGSTPSSYIPTSGATVTRAAETLTIAGANMSASTTAMSFHHQGEINYADEGAAAQQTFWRWQTDANNYLSADLDTDSTDTGEVNANQADGGTVDTVTSDSYSPGINVAFNIATRNTNGAINLAVDGTAVTEDSTPTSLNDASGDTFQIGYDMMGTHALFRQWAADIGDTGIESATS